jgi:hypothetical protein
MTSNRVLGSPRTLLEGVELVGLESGLVDLGLDGPEFVDHVG